MDQSATRWPKSAKSPVHKPRIAFLLPGIGIVHRGAETFVLELADRLSGKFEVTTLCRGRANRFCWPVCAISRDALVLTQPYRYRIGRKVQDKLFLDPLGAESLSFSLNVIPPLVRARYDLLLPVNGVWGALACRLIRRAYGTPFITVGHAGIGRPDLWQVRQRPNVHVVLTEHARLWMTGICPDLRVQVIPNGVDIIRFHPDLTPVSLPLERPRYLCAAAAVSYKNIRLTIEAVSRLSRGSLLVLGRGPLKAELEAQGMRQLGPQRFMMQDVPHTEMPNYFAACDVFTLVSERECEAFGIVYLEAMACNKPVVATDDPIRAEIVRDAGILCDGYHMDAYVRALERAANLDFGDQPRRQAEKFSWDSIALEYQQLIEACLPSR
jgi:glycosyltransferase involved in cell wall biosynthesis